MVVQKRFRTRVNFQIRVPQVRVIDVDGEQLGVLETEKALALAEEKGLDLVEVSPTARPPVCRIVDYGKFKYEKNKRLRQSKKKQHVIHVKEIKLRPKIEEHDYQFKKRHAEEFLEKLHKVKFTVIFRGREMDHRELGARILERLQEDLKEVGAVERAPQFEGRLMTMFMGPASTKAAQPKPEAKPEPKTRPKAGAEPESKAKPKAKAKTKADAKTRTDSESKSKEEQPNAET